MTAEDRRLSLIDWYTRARSELNEALAGLSGECAFWDEQCFNQVERIAAGGQTVLRDMTDEQHEALNRLVAGCALGANP